MTGIWGRLTDTGDASFKRELHEHSEQHEQPEQREQREQREQYKQRVHSEQRVQYEQYEQSEQFVQSRQSRKLSSAPCAASLEPKYSREHRLLFESVNQVMLPPRGQCRFRRPPLDK